jgi:regulator of sirC expression with transglutaminase-like and TPR domain
MILAVNGPAPALLDLLAGRPSTISLDRAALEAARVDDPALDAERYIAELDRHAFEIAERAHDLSDPECFIRATNDYLFTEHHFRGNNDDYYNPHNNLLSRVLDTGLGVPITLSVVYIEIARRLAKPVRGIGLPGHFVIRYDDGDFSTFLDPFRGGAALTPEGCLAIAQEITGNQNPDPAWLEPSEDRSIIMRILNNLRGAYFSRRESAHALNVLDLLIAANPAAAEEHKQRGVALMGLDRIADSLAAFRRYLELAPDAEDRDAIQSRIHDLAFWLASRN